MSKASYNIMLVTDKNLDCTVTLRIWIINKITCFFLSQKDYEYINYDTTIVLIKKNIKAVQELADLTENSIHYGTFTQLLDFFQSQILNPFDENLQKLSKFYVIPKIHKMPVSVRSILSYYSVVQGPIEKFVFKY